MKIIKSITGQTALIGENDNIQSEYISSFQEFDDNKNLIKKVIYSENGEFETFSEYKYDEKNKLIEEIQYLEEDEVGERIKYKYDDSGILIEETLIYSDGASSIKKYNIDGNILTVNVYDESGNLEEEEIKKFNDNDKILEVTIYNEDKEIDQKYTFDYDDKQNMICSTEYGNKGEFVVKKDLEYDEKGNLIKESSYNGKGRLINVLTFEHDENGNMTSQQIGNRHLLKMTYDEQNRRIKEETINLNINLVETMKIFKYDEESLLIEEISYDMGRQFTIEKGAKGISDSNYLSTKYKYEFK